MTEFESIRGWLSGQSGNLNEIARKTGVNRRTIQRIVNDTNYAVKSTTSAALKRYMDAALAESVHESSAEA